MKERPIPFSAPMVRVLLAGTKTQTRRVVKQFLPCAPEFDSERGVWELFNGCDVAAEFRCPYGHPGDHLWVREAWRTVAEADALPPRDLDAAYRLWMEANAPHQPGFGKYRPPMFMPRWASRIALEITGVRVERLQAISEADAMAEGVDPPSVAAYRRSALRADRPAGFAFRDLWMGINGADSWAANPWVWVVEFKRVEAA